MSESVYCNIVCDNHMANTITIIIILAVILIIIIQIRRQSYGEPQAPKYPFSAGKNTEDMTDYTIGICNWFK